MTKRSYGEMIGEALFELLVESSSEPAQELLRLTREFRQKYHRSYLGLMRVPFTRHILEAIVEADEFLNLGSEPDVDANAEAGLEQQTSDWAERTHGNE